MNKMFRFWKEVFSHFKYITSTLIIALLFYSLNVVILNFRTILSFYSYLGFLGSIKLFLSFLIDLEETIKIGSFISLIIISMLLGLLFSLISYKTNTLKKANNKSLGFISSIGVILGVLAPGCAACGIGLASSLGISAVFLSLLPLKGLELSIFSIVLLMIAIFKISSDSCKVMFNKNVKGGKRK